MPTFTLRGLSLTLPATALRGSLGRALASGRYEHQEADALLAHLVPGDRFLDLGAGLGFLCALAARVIGETAVAGIEASPDAIEFAEATLAANGFAKVRLIHGAVVGGRVAPEADGEVDFGLRPAFWASALRGPQGWPDNAEVIGVPAWTMADLLKATRPTVICCDIEGGEIEVLTEPLPGVRLLIVEFHPAVYGDAGVDRIAGLLADQGFDLEPKGSQGTTLVFAREQSLIG